MTSHGGHVGSASPFGYKGHLWQAELVSTYALGPGETRSC